MYLSLNLTYTLRYITIQYLDGLPQPHLVSNQSASLLLEDELNALLLERGEVLSNALWHLQPPDRVIALQEAQTKETAVKRPEDTKRARKVSRPC